MDLQNLYCLIELHFFANTSGSLRSGIWDRLDHFVMVVRLNLNRFNMFQPSHGVERPLCKAQIRRCSFSPEVAGPSRSPFHWHGQGPEIVTQGVQAVTMTSSVKY